jgi:methionyl aminopeptidase
MNVERTLLKEPLIHSGKILASALDLSKRLISEKITPLEIDLEVHKFIVEQKAVPSFLGLGGFPYSICISINDQVVHGIPVDRYLKQGDLVTVDVGVSFDGHCTDAARTFVVGKTKNKIKNNLIVAANEALDAGIQKAVAGNKVGDISYAIQKCIESSGFRSPLCIGGHGIGMSAHLDPFIPNTGMPGRGIELLEGLCLAIEPVVMAGSIDIFVSKQDNFTMYSKDGCLSSHVEDTIIVTSRAPLILTRETLNGGLI